jgi:hypothetical protein
MYLGADVLKDVIENAELYPIRGLFNFTNYFDEIDAYYHRTFGHEFGFSTGWRALNELYNVSANLHLYTLSLSVCFGGVDLYYFFFWLKYSELRSPVDTIPLVRALLQFNVMIPTDLQLTMLSDSYLRFGFFSW